MKISPIIVNFVPFLLLFLFSCTKNNKNDVLQGASGKFYQVDLNLSSEFYDTITNHIPTPELTILKENENTMYAFIDRLIDRNGKYFILDSTDGKTVVSFTHDGEPYANYGTIGKGPGEYIMPSDIDIKSDGVYVLDTSQKKIVHYNEKGSYIKEIKLPFFADAFTFLENGNIMFNLMPDGNISPRICITDSLINNIKYYLTSENGYLGGLYTSDKIRKYENNVCFYKAPTDTLFVFTPTGESNGGMIFSFGDLEVSKKAKLDFLSARKEGDIENKLMLINNPIQIKNDLWVGVMNMNETQYTVLFDPLNNKSGIRVFDNTSSVFDILVPLGVTEDKKLISLLDIEFAEQCPDFQQLPDSIRTALYKNDRVLAVFDLN